MCIFYINESNQALIPYLPPESTFCSRIYFPRHYTKSVKNIVTPSITLFTADQQYLNVAGLFGCLLETQAERYFIVVRAGRASGRERYLVPFSLSVVSCLFCFWFYLEFVDFFSPYSFVILLVGGGGVAEWCRGFSNKRVKWYFYHINFNYSIPCVSH